MTKVIRFDRLKKLADHLMNGKLGHKKFTFSDLNTFPDGYVGKRNICGTLGCALGECPIIFIKEWIFNTRGDPCYKSENPFKSASLFFNVSISAAEHLFCPYQQDTIEFGGKKLNDNSSRKLVAKNIYAFIEKMKEEKS